MGVRGLTTYISNHHKKYLKSFKLHNCYVIIDGNSLACQLYVRFASRAHCAFGGDYDRYAKYIRDFFNLLTKCDIKAIVIFDGGYEPRKVATVISRMVERIAAMKHVKPCSQDSAVVFPLFLRIVFKQVLKELNVPFVQCDFEADQEIASLAQKYDCPVLSYDSDFYIFDVTYIPIPLIEFEAAPLTFEIGQSSEKYCINCKMYKIDFFLESFGGLDKTMLPLLASLLGNDYVKIKAFRNFYAQLKVPKGKSNPLQRKIAKVIEWLRNETFESAIEKILGRMKRTRHKSITRIIANVVNAYTNLNVTTESFLPSDFTSRTQVKNSNKIDCSRFCVTENFEENTDVEMEEIENELSEESSASESENEEDLFDEVCGKKINKSSSEMDVDMPDQVKDIKESVTKVTIKFPDWLLESSRRGNIESCITDILTLGTYFAMPQIEDTFYQTSHFTCTSLIKIICKLLIGNSSQSQQISIWTKNDYGKVQRFLLHFSDTPKITDLESVPALTCDERKLLLLQCLNLPSDFNLDYFPDEWKLYVCAIVYWIQNTKQPPVTECHLISICMCMFALSVIDSKVGFFRKKIAFLKKFGKLQKKILKRIELGFTEPEINESDSEKVDSSSYNEEQSGNNELQSDLSQYNSIKDLLSLVTAEDCISVYEEFYLFHQLDENLKVDRSLFSMQDIHIFAQFQSCLFHIMLLNSLFAFPFQQPTVSSLYSGTFVYNLCIALKRFKNTTKYLESLLNYAPNIKNLITTMYSEIVKIAPVVPVQEIKKSRRRKRRKTSNRNHKAELDGDDAMEQTENNESNSYYDENNAFSLLSSM